MRVSVQTVLPALSAEPFPWVRCCSRHKSVSFLWQAAVEPLHIPSGALSPRLSANSLSFVKRTLIRQASGAPGWA